MGKYTPFQVPYVYIFGAFLLGLCGAAIVFHPTGRLLSLMYHWQTLLAGSFAIGAAYMGGYFLRQSDERLRRRKAKAARALLSEYLSDMQTVLVETIRIGIELLPLARGPRFAMQIDEAFWTDVQMPVVNSDIVNCFKDNVELSEDELSDALVVFLREWQIHRSRLTGKLEDLRFPSRNGVLRSVAPHSIAISIRDACKLHASLTKLYPLAREDKDAVIGVPDDEDIRGAYILAGFRDDVAPEFFDLIDGGR